MKFTQENKINITACNLHEICHGCQYHCRLGVKAIDVPKQPVTDNTIQVIGEYGTKWLPTIDRQPVMEYFDANNVLQSNTKRNTAEEALELLKEEIIPLCDHYQNHR